MPREFGGRARRVITMAQFMAAVRQTDHAKLSQQEIVRVHHEPIAAAACSTITSANCASVPMALA